MEEVSGVEALATSMRPGGEWESHCTPEELLLQYGPHTSESFRHLFKQAVEAYLGGPTGEASNWKEATVLLQQCREVRPGDGPSERLLSFVSQHADKDENAPSWWRGFRSLEEK
mmetsp:Transcript_20870/g.42354  ORF Transcript_20870/g.42354 Transcript_20870/m.42354 type:complete len:114 (+) Transcript_20870:305-646(+)